MFALLSLPKTILANRRLIWQLALHDLRSRYSATLMGSIWAVVNPMILLLVFWFVSVQGLKISLSDGPPFFLVMFCGLVPWMAFSEGVNAGANAVLMQAHLVKKIAFPTEILPFVQITSTIIIHFFIVALLLLILLIYDTPVTIHWLSAIYYLFSMMALSSGLAMGFSALNVLHRDIGHALSAVVTLWFWTTPIIWPAKNLSEPMRAIMQLNPMYYIVEGYRDALLFARPIGSQWPLDAYFWGVTLALLVLGASLFRRLKPHFADVL